MNIFKDIVLDTEKPAVLPLKKTEKSQMMVIGLGKGAILKKHKTSVSNNLVVAKGSIAFEINNETLHFAEGEVYDIPLDAENEVTGLDEENFFIITKEL